MKGTIVLSVFLVVGLVLALVPERVADWSRRSRWQPIRTEVWWLRGTGVVFVVLALVGIFAA